MKFCVAARTVKIAASKKGRMQKCLRNFLKSFSLLKTQLSFGLARAFKLENRWGH
jgi:hypothetical protein